MTELDTRLAAQMPRVSSAQTAQRGLGGGVMDMPRAWISTARDMEVPRQMGGVQRPSPLPVVEAPPNQTSDLIMTSGMHSQALTVMEAQQCPSLPVVEAPPRQALNLILTKGLHRQALIMVGV